MSDAEHSTPTPPEAHPIVLKARLDALEERDKNHRTELWLAINSHEGDIVHLKLFREKINTMMLVGPFIGSILGGVIVAVIIKLIGKG